MWYETSYVWKIVETTCKNYVVNTLPVRHHLPKRHLCTLYVYNDCGSIFGFIFCPSARLIFRRNVFHRPPLDACKTFHRNELASFHTVLLTFFVLLRFAMKRINSLPPSFYSEGFIFSLRFQISNKRTRLFVFPRSKVNCFSSSYAVLDVCLCTCTA